MPPGKYGMQEEWEKEGDQEINMDFLLPTGIFLKFPVSPNETIRNIKKVHASSQSGTAGVLDQPSLLIVHL